MPQNTRGKKKVLLLFLFVCFIFFEQVLSCNKTGLFRGKANKILRDYGSRKSNCFEQVLPCDKIGMFRSQAKIANFCPKTDSFRFVYSKLC